MNPSLLSSEILDYCKANKNDELVKKYSYYFKEAYNAWGLTSPHMRSKAKEIVKSKSYDLSEIMDAAPHILQNGKYEEIQILIILLSNYQKNYSEFDFIKIEKWFSYSIHNWAHADTLAMFVLPYFLKLKICTLGDFQNWIVSPYKFQRRCVPVSFIKLLKTQGNFSDLFEIIEPLMTDPEREVHQGVGWFLREAWKIKREETELFLLKWKNVCPRLIIQYACEKMTKDEKLLFKRES